MKIEAFTKRDFDEVLTHLLEFWPSDYIRPLHHPMLIHEFGDTAYVIRNEGCVAGYLLGFFATANPTAYVHLVGVREPYRRQGLARELYQHYISQARTRGCTQLKAITTPANSTSIAFHRSIGMELEGDVHPDYGVPVVLDYSGPGQHRVVFRRSI